MVGPSKILTVSYGTFSCTLEGFDEPFGTMQAIAEYFRDLAAQDRYFGAEPPTPDAEMLHRIAEREVQRRVESRVQENGIILRQQPDSNTAPGVVAPYAMANVLKSVVQGGAAPSGMMSAAAANKASATPEPAPETDAEDMPASEPMSSDVSDKLARIRAAVAKSETMQDAEEDTVEDEASDAQAHAAPEADLWDTPDTAPDMPELEDTLASLMAEDEVNQPADSDSLTDDAEDMAEDSLAADEDATFGDDFAEEGAPDTPQDTLSLPTMDQPVAEQPVAAQSSADEELDEYDDFGLFDEDDDDTPQAKARPAPSAVLAAAAPVAGIAAHVAAKRSGQDTTAEAEEDQFEDDFEEDEYEAEAEAEIQPAKADVPDTPPADVAPRAPERPEPAQAQPSMAEVIDEDDFEAELERELQDSARQEEERHSIETLRSEIRAVLGQTGLSGQSETSLIDELAVIEQEAVIKHPHFNRKAKKRIPGDTETTAERLLETANSALGEHDSKRRRETFEHIKVAVAATRAEEIVEGPRRRDIEQDREIEKYRAGMEAPAPLDPAMARAEQRAKVVEEQTSDEAWDEDEDVAESAPVEEVAEIVAPKRAPATMRPVAAPAPTPVAEPEPYDASAGSPRPRRPAMAGARKTQRPSVARAPLVLVSEQRVDTETAPSGPVRPRRVRASQSAEAIAVKPGSAPVAKDTLDSFKTFADDVDAWLLDDQIEAAAAYSTHILGQQEFSRPELMNFVLAYNEGKEVSREDMLRGFGTLLREGRLERGNAGAFRLAPASEYDEPARKYAQR